MVILIVIVFVTLPPKENVNVLLLTVYLIVHAAPSPLPIPLGALDAGTLDTPLPEVKLESLVACVKLPDESVLQIPTIGYVPLASL